ncbi:hypothetical protein VNI00_010751 [Paramarasmius palmivorus]|uniref:Uncharacterized protein n=1 Tax=Paramarasmius palmivorus TaxID=297713 RepID=A0AAW0CHV3_9AGAR
MHLLNQFASLVTLTGLSINWSSNNNVYGTIHGYIRLVLTSLYLKPPGDPDPSLTIPLVFEPTSTTLFNNEFESGIWTLVLALTLVVCFSGLSLGCRKSMAQLALIATCFSPIIVVVYLCPDMLNFTDSPFILDILDFWNSLTLDNYTEIIQQLYTDESTMTCETIVPFLSHLHQSLIDACGYALLTTVASKEMGFRILMNLAEGGRSVIDSAYVLGSNALQAVHGVPLPTVVYLAFVILTLWAYGAALTHTLVQLYRVRSSISRRLVTIVTSTSSFTIDAVVNLFQVASAVARIVSSNIRSITNSIARFYSLAYELATTVHLAYNSPGDFVATRCIKPFLEWFITMYMSSLQRTIILIVSVPFLKPSERREVVRTLFYIDETAQAYSAAMRAIVDTFTISPCTIHLTLFVPMKWDDLDSQVLALDVVYWDDGVLGDSDEFGDYQSGASVERSLKLGQGERFICPVRLVVY